MLELINDALYGLIARLRRELIKYIVGYAGCLQLLLDEIEETKLPDTLIREGCNLLCADCSEDRRDVLHGIRSTINCLRHLQTVLLK